MNIKFDEIGDPIELEDYLEEYRDHVSFVLRSTLSIDRKDSQYKKLFNMEMIRAEAKWHAFYEIHFRAPDYQYLQNEVISFGLERLQLFEKKKERLPGEINVDDFVNYHIQQLKLEKVLSPLLFEKNDLRFLERYAKNKAIKYFNDRDKKVEGYEEFRISKNQTMQHAGYEQLKYEFVSDTMVEGYFKEEVAKMAVNDERVAEFVLDESKGLMRNLTKQMKKGGLFVGVGSAKLVVKQVHKQRTTGKQRYKQLQKNGALEHIDVGETDLKPIAKELKKYKVDFAVKKNKETNKIHVFFKAKDRDTLNLALENVLQKFAEEKDKPQQRQKQQQEASEDKKQEQQQEAPGNKQQEQQQTRPQEQQARSQGQQARPQGEQTRSQGQQVRPQVQQARPQGQQTRPQGQQVRPQEQQARPQGQQVRPQGQQTRFQGQQTRSQSKQQEQPQGQRQGQQQANQQKQFEEQFQILPQDLEYGLPQEQILPQDLEYGLPQDQQYVSTSNNKSTNISEHDKSLTAKLDKLENTAEKLNKQRAQQKNKAKGKTKEPVR